MTADRHARFELVLFGAGGRRFAVEASRVAAMRPLHGASAEARSAEDLLGLPAASFDGGAARRELLLRTADGELPLLVEEPVELRAVPCAAIHAPPALLAACCRLPLAALLVDEGSAVPILRL